MIEVESLDQLLNNAFLINHPVFLKSNAIQITNNSEFK